MHLALNFQAGTVSTLYIMGKITISDHVYQAASVCKLLVLVRSITEITQLIKQIYCFPKTRSAFK